MTRWLCAHLPFFRTERITRASQAPDRPLATVEERGDGVRLVAVSAGAMAIGVLPGMTATAARALLPALELAAFHADAEAEDLEALAAALYRFTPRVFMDAPHALLLDITGCERLFSGEDALAAQVVALLQRLGYRVSIGIADNPTKAYVLALEGRGAGDDACVRAACVAALRLNDSDLRHLDALGVRTVGDLMALPAESLPARFSEVLTARLRALRGHVLEEFPAFHPPRLLRERLDFTGPTDRRDSLMFALRRVSVALEERLAAQGVGALQLDAGLRGEGRPVTFSIALSRPTRDSRSLAGLLLGRFESVDTDGQWFDGIEVSVPAVAGLRPPQRDLFSDRDPAREQSLLELVDELSGFLGPQAVARASLTADPRPEHSVVFGSFTPDVGPAGAPRAPRPLVVFDPHEVRVECDDAGRPVRWHDGSRDSRLVHVAGPERVHFGWWSGDGAARDYHVVEDEAGARWRLEHRGNRWHIVGAC